tara:strand:+ start:1454 stop:2077 length:624 start_codon:yes stop_codon:yes gene_type:complete
MINTILKELKSIAQSILDQDDVVDLVNLESKLQALQRQIIILGHEQAKINSDAPTKIKAVVEEIKKQTDTTSTPRQNLRIEENKVEEARVASFDNLFSSVINEPVFVKKENPLEEILEDSGSIIKNLNDKLGKGLKIGLNDRLAFIKNLFDGSTEEYQRVISQVFTYDTIEESKNFIENLVKPDYNFWEGKESFEERFNKIIEQNFS